MWKDARIFYYPGDLSKEEAACGRYVQACCEHGLSGDAALCVCAGSDGNNNNNGNAASLAIIIPVVVAAVLLVAAVLFLVHKRVVAARQHRRESMPTVGGEGEVQAEA